MLPPERRQWVEAVGSAGVGPLYKQHQTTRTVGNPFADLILPQGFTRPPLLPVSQPNPLPVLPNLHAFVDCSIQSFPIQSPWLTVLQPPAPHPMPYNSHFPHAPLDLSGNPQSATTWSIAQAQAGTPRVASNSGTLAGDLGVIQVAVGNPANMIPSEQDFTRSLVTIQEDKLKIEFNAEVGVIVGVVRVVVRRPMAEPSGVVIVRAVVT